MLVLKSSNLYRRSSSLLLCFNLSSIPEQINYLNRNLDLFLSNPLSEFQSLLQSHASIITTGNSNNIFIAAKLISFYSSFNKPDFFTQVFDSINPKDTFLWNSIIESHFSNGEYLSALEFYLRMRVSNTPPNHFTIPMVIAACAELLSLKHGKNIHSVALKLGLFAGNSAVGSSFVYMYSKCGEMEHASHMFDEIPLRDVVAWTALVIGYVQNEESEKCLDCFRKMHRSGEDEERPNFRTIEGVLQACGKSGTLLEGRCLHGFAVKTGIRCSTVVQSSLLSMYSKCGSTEEAHFAFHEVANKDLISWTAIINAYGRSGKVAECLELFWKMQVSDVDPDALLISRLIMGFGNSMRVHEGKAFHGLIVKINFEFDQTINNSLLSMYCKFGCLDFMEKLFNGMHENNMESWNWMVYGYGRIGLEPKCVELFKKMQYLGLESDLNSFVSVITSCSQLLTLHLGQSLHCHVIKIALDENVSISNALVGMYGRCGNLTVAQKIFHRMHKDIVTWNTLISVHTHCGQYSEALALFYQMIGEGMKPNSATLVTVLSACSRMAALDDGKKVHTYIKEMGLECDLSLSTSLVDMYAKCGKLVMSREIFDLMQERDIVTWNVMISGYGIHGDAKSAMEIFVHMEESGVRPNELTFLAVLSACAHAGLIKEGKYLFSRMREYDVVPTLKHYACMVDLLGRCGNLYEAEAMVLSMPVAPDGGVWGALLGACKIHNDIEMGERVAMLAIESDPENDGYYILMSNMYSSIGKWDEAERVRGMMKGRGVKKSVGLSTV